MINEKRANRDAREATLRLKEATERICDGVSTAGGVPLEDSTPEQ
jgi:hypothetical protein